MKKVFFKETDWNNLVMYLAEKKIAWENEAYFQFDTRTAVILIIGGCIGAVIVSIF
jgi:hypothetical protein